MNSPTRKRQPLPMDDDDKAAMERTARQGGLKGATASSGAGGSASTKPTPGARTPDPAPAKLSEAPAIPSPDNPNDPAALFSRNDLRPQIAYGSELAQAVADVFSGLDPATRRYVKPSTMLKDFLVENDAALAKLFRKSGSL